MPREFSAKHLFRDVVATHRFTGGFLLNSNIFFGQADTDDELTNSGYVYLFDAARTALHNGGLSQRFDRFYCSADLEHEVDSAVGLVGGGDKVMVHRPVSSQYDHYDENISDHFPVTLAVDVSVERP